MEKNAVQSIGRAMGVLEALSARPAGMGLVELAAAVELHKSTAHRLLASLTTLGYVVQDSASGRYKLTLRMYEVGSRAVAGMDVLAAARPHLEAFSRLCGEAVHLVVPSGVDIVYIHKIDSGHNGMGMSSREGLRIPMYCTAVGKAILAAMPANEVAEIWSQSDIKQLTPNTIIDLNTLQKQLEAIRAQGYAIDDEENEAGIRCVAVALVGAHGRALAAFSASAPVGRMGASRVKQIAAEALNAKQAILRDLGL